MNSFSGLFKSRDKPKDASLGGGFRFYMGQTSSGKMVTERSAMQISAVYACVRVLSEAVAGMPLHLYRYTDDGGKEKATDHPLYFLLHDEPNSEMSSFVFRTVNYVGFAGHASFGSGTEAVGGETLIRVDYRRYVSGENDYIYGK